MFKNTGLVLLTASALSIIPGTAGADAPAGERIDYTVSPTGQALIVEMHAGTLANDSGTFTMKAADGTVLAGAELSFKVDDFVFPIVSEITDRTAVLTPQFDLGHAVYQPVALPYENQAPWKSEYEREQAAWGRLASTIGLGVSVGALVGSLAGGTAGCVLGGIVGATVASATLIGLFGPFIPAAAVGCLGGIAAVGALGSLAGQVFIAAPVAILAAAQYFTTINSPAPGK